MTSVPDLPPIPPLDRAAMAAASARMDSLTKPRASLGRLEALAIQIAGIQGVETPRLATRAAVVVAADHGVTAQGVSAYPQAVTRQMLANFLAGGAAINVLTRAAGCELVVVDAGVVEAVADPRIVDLRLGPGTADFSRGPAMSREAAVRAVEAGLALARQRLVADAVACGEMGIGNTTAAAAIIACILGATPSVLAGPGAGLAAEAVTHKAAVIEAALSLNQPDASDAMDVLTKVGGFEIGVLAGIMIGAASAHRVVVIDGVISAASALIAARLAPEAAAYMVASHLSAEPAHAFVLRELGLTPVLDLGLRLGEGTGAVLALPILEAACLLLAEMATFDSAGISGRSGAPDANFE